MKPTVLALLSLGLAVAVTGCEQKPKLAAPTGRGLCFYAAKTNDSYRFDQIASGVADLEHCAAELEKTRMGLNRIGTPPGDVVGAYQGRFLFLTDYGIFTSPKIDGTRFLLMVRYGDKLVMPGAVPQQ